MTTNDFDGLAELLGLDAAKLRTGEGAMETFNLIREGAARKVVVRDLDNRKILEIGDRLWPLPFPITEREEGKWAFDTYVGLEEIVNRRVGENELEAIETVRAYVEAQKDYAERDRDADGVFEYAQKLISSPGQTDGLYWPADQHALPEHMAHGASKVQLQLVAVLSLIALFTHNHLFWIAALLLALIEFPDFSSPITSMADSLRKIADRNDRPLETALMEPQEKPTKPHPAQPEWTPFEPGPSTSDTLSERRG
ncbi:DUF2950 family protein [Sinorhizobium meliloti]|nr:DUF2950 family protein [Sinorhizobium meliloti]